MPDMVQQYSVSSLSGGGALPASERPKGTVLTI